MAHAHAKAKLSEPSTVDAFLDKDFWTGLAPNFSIGSKIGNYAFDVSEAEKTKYNAKMIKEGYIHVVQPGLNSPFEEMTKIFTEIVSRGLPPVFAFVYDELWMMNTQIRNLMSATLHEQYAQLPDFWAWRVTPGQAGWKPHRDKVGGCLFPDKSPKSLTVWMPINEAHPLNGCMYVLPADRDSEYGIDGSVRGIGPLPDIRALPAQAGDILAWTQHVFHWGGHSADEHDMGPRMAVAFEYQRSDIHPFNKPLLNPAIVPNFEERLALISKQVMQYRHMYGFHEDLVSLAEKIAGKYQMPRGMNE